MYTIKENRMSKYQQIAEHVVVTFFEAAIAYLAINQTNLSGNAKLTAIGALGAGLSAAYNVVRQSAPTLPVVTPAAPVVLSPSKPVAGVGTAIGGGISNAPVVIPAEPVVPDAPVTPEVSQ